MSTPVKKGPPKVSGLVRDGVISGAPHNAVIRVMPSFAPAAPVPAGIPDTGKGIQDARPTPPQPEGHDHEPMRMLPIGLIDASPFQNRLNLTEERVAALAENIREDGLNNPITVRLKDDGRYELVAGETRLRAYRSLGHAEIPAFVRNMDDTHSARSTVLDNFFHESLTDYEIYKGLRTLLDTGAATSVRTLAEITPWGRSQVQRLMAFGRLPAAALEILEAHPGIVGGVAAETLAALADKGPREAELVAQAVARVRDGKTPQTRAAAWAEAQAAGRKAAGQGRAGRAVVTTAAGAPLFTVDRVEGGGGIRIKGAKGTDADWEEIQAALVELLKSRGGVP